MVSAAHRDPPSTAHSSFPVNSSHTPGIRAGPSSAWPGAGRRRISSATAACLRAAACASTRSHAHSTPSTSSSEAPSKESPAPAASWANAASSGRPGITSNSIPEANWAARLGYSPGKTRADPG
jgi:hypothetical protein